MEGEPRSAKKNVCGDCYDADAYFLFISLVRARSIAAVTVGASVTLVDCETALILGEGELLPLRRGLENGLTASSSPEASAEVDNFTRLA